MSHSKSEIFYEHAWALRLEFLNKTIQEGEKHPLRLISKLNSHENYHILSVDPETNQARYLPKFGDISANREVVNVIKNGTKIDIKSVAFLPTKVPVFRTKPVLGTYYDLPSYFNENVAAFLADYLHDKQFDAVVELGSGYARNLIELYYQGGPQIPYYAGEYTNSGTEMAKILASLASEIQLRPFFFDYKTPSLAEVKEKGRVFCFTCHSVEQVEQLPQSFFKCLAGHAEKVTCIHFEPFGYQVAIGEKSIVDKEHESFFTKKGWNKNLFKELITSYVKDEIELTYIGKNIMGGERANPMSIAVWHNKTIRQ
ncbi:MAG: hypothetical protein HQM16_03405 [Deltaproteobacteria bacterium]|nr:hypothetical protein [Deltaproteobacteria bacterium]